VKQEFDAAGGLVSVISVCLLDPELIFYSDEAVYTKWVHKQ
jgi:hypothetical protein